MYKFTTNLNKFESELRDVIRMFVPYFDAEIDIKAVYNYDKKDFIINIDSTENDYKYDGMIENDGQNFNDSKEIREFLVFCKISLYQSLSGCTKTDLPWGSLTGIRPTKIVYKLLSQGKTLDESIKTLKNKYLVSTEKTNLIKEIIQNQNNLIYHTPEYVNLYVHIPFCPTKCGYCSFVTLPTEKHHKLINPYLDCLIEEIRQTKAIIKAQNKRILSVYIGGGTPTVLDEIQLEKLLKAIDINGVEYTVEAGRPDTITPQKLQALKQNGATRVCINPQTFAEKTLINIGRRHSVSEIYTTFDLAKQFGFDINMDLIAGLPGETVQDFAYTLDCAIDLKPANITVHSLSFKNGSELSQSAVNDPKPIKGQADNNIKLRSAFDFNPAAPAMIQLAHSRLRQADYLPYYLYRQKNMSGNLENTGYCLKGKQSVNNITVMEETVSVYACGAGAISKTIMGNRIERLANLRDVPLYIKEFKDRLNTKKVFLLNVECKT